MVWHIFFVRKHITTNKKHIKQSINVKKVILFLLLTSFVAHSRNVFIFFDSIWSWWCNFKLKQEHLDLKVFVQIFPGSYILSTTTMTFFYMSHQLTDQITSTNQWSTIGQLSALDSCPRHQYHDHDDHVSPIWANVLNI